MRSRAASATQPGGLLLKVRGQMLERFPYLVFYVERDDHIDVWRVLHGHRDIPSWMRDPDEPASQR